MYPLYKVFKGPDDSCRRIVKFTGPTIGYDHWYLSTGYNEAPALEAGWIPHDRTDAWRSFKSVEEGLMGLPAAYSALAIQRMKEQPDFAKTFDHYPNPSSNLIHAFDWAKTPEGNLFWDQVYMGNHPEIPGTKEEETAVPLLRIKTAKRPGLVDLILNILEEKGITSNTGDYDDTDAHLCFGNVPASGKDSQVWSTNSDYAGEYTVIPYLDFILQIENLPGKKKEKESVIHDDLIDGYNIQFNPQGSVTIGCQLFDEENIERIIKEINDWRNTKIIANGSYYLFLSEKGIRIQGGSTVSFADFDKFREKLGAYKQS